MALLSVPIKWAFTGVGTTGVAGLAIAVGVNSGSDESSESSRTSVQSEGISTSHSSDPSDVRTRDSLENLGASPGGSTDFTRGLRGEMGRERQQLQEKIQQDRAEELY